tara:strand:- start:18 stop:602 length:585 start_codon:yes stop_codon:yes gene_type:complete
MIFSVSDLAHKWAMQRKPFYNQHTIKEGGDIRGKYTGNIGEFFFSEALQKNNIDHCCVGSSIHSHDFVVGSITIDTKAKERTYSYIDRPGRLDADEGHIALNQEGFACDIYVFASSHASSSAEPAQSVQFIGWISKASFWKQCQRVGKGEETAPNFFERADAGKLPYKKLSPMGLLLDNLSDHMTKNRFDKEIL